MRVKKLLCSILAICMVLSTMTLTVLAEESEATVVGSGTYGGIDWTLDSEGTLTIAPTAGEPEPDHNAPTKRVYSVGEWREAVVYKASGSASAIGGYPYNVKAVKSLVIEEGVTKIGSFAGQFPNLTGTVVIPSTVTYIGQEAFHKAPIDELIFAEGGTDPLCIANGAFKKTNIESIALPGDREYIHVHHWAFGGSPNLKYAYIPANITKVWGGEHVDYFDNFNSQTNVTWSEYGSIFTGCTEMVKITFENEAARDLFYSNNRNTTNEDYIVGVVGLTAYGRTVTDEMLEAVAEGGKLMLCRNFAEDITTTGELEISFKNGSQLTGDIILASEDAEISFTSKNNFKGNVVPYGDYKTSPKEDTDGNIVYENCDSLLIKADGSEAAYNFDEAIANAEDGDTIKLLMDVEYNIALNPVATMALGDGVIIDLNGKTISPADPTLPTFVAGEKYTITNGTIEGDVVIEAGEVEIADATIDGNLEVTSGSVTMATGAITGEVEVADTASASFSGGEFGSDVSAYVAANYEVVRTAFGYVVIEKGSQADSISIEYRDTNAGIEGEKTYEIVVKANAGEVINELASVDLTFAFTEAPIYNGDITFTVAPAEKFAMTEHDSTVREELTKRYMFNYNGVGNNYEGTAKEIIIGTITVTGYGEFTIGTKDLSNEEVDTNVVHATTLYDNLVDSYTVAGATDNNATTGALDITGSIADEIAVPVRTLTINIDFPNAVEDNAIAYQDMKVEITGTIDGVQQTITYNLGTDEEAMNAEGSYVVTEDRLVLNNAYTVTVSGAGYRTARYTVTMTEDKALKFWNNVMDEAQVVEIGKDSSAVNVTFLAGDIVKDNKINIYDLSAVVSYFGTQTVDEGVILNADYAKYDLNRDGVIDSKDVAYVLVSWDN